ncbi:MAG: hypothetical protein QM831_32655 [Kofleriaceae bacterium]
MAELTFFLPIVDTARLTERLSIIEANHDGNSIFHPSELPRMHFMRFVIIPDAELGNLLAWGIDIDGDEDEWLHDALLVPGLAQIFECCAEFPGMNAAAEWLLAHRVKAAAQYCAYPYVTAAEITHAKQVHDTIRTYVDSHSLVNVPFDEVQRRLAEAAQDREPVDDNEDWFLLLKIAGVILAIPVIVALLLIVIFGWYAVLRTHEKADAEAFAGPSHPVHDRDLGKFEDKIRQNQLTHVVDVKPGFFRLFTVWTVLHVIDGLARIIYVRGHLGGITSIHFARWMIVRDRRHRPKQRRHRIVFFSNYDGSWESYLGEFIDRASWGLTAIWSNTKDFPPTTNLAFDGAKDEEAFKQWTRDHQLETQVWWSSVPDQTVQNINDDVALRRKLDATLDREEMMAWLRRV